MRLRSLSAPVSILARVASGLKPIKQVLASYSEPGCRTVLRVDEVPAPRRLVATFVSPRRFWQLGHRSAREVRYMPR